MNDLPLHVKNQISIYADDTCIWSEMPTEREQINSLNEDLEAIRKWSNINRVDFHPQKFQWLRLKGPRSPDPPEPAAQLLFGFQDLQIY